MNLASFSLNVSPACDLRIASASASSLVLYLRWSTTTIRENNRCIQSQVRMLKPTHKRPRGWVGVPSHELGFLLGQHFARPGFADCLCLSLYQSFVVVLAADLVSQKSSVSAKGAYNHRCACQRVTCSSICTVTYTACTVTYTAMHTSHTDPVRMESARVVAFSMP